MSTLVAFDEIEQRLQSFSESAFGENSFEAYPISRGLAFSLVSLGWEGTPGILADAFIAQTNDEDTFTKTLERLGYSVKRETKAGFERLREVDYPCWISSSSFSGILSGYDETKNELCIYDYRNDNLFYKQADEKHYSIVHITRYSRLFREPPPESQDKSNWIKYCFYRYSTELKQLTILSFFISIFGAINPFFIMLIYSFALGAGSISSLAWLTAGAMVTAFLEYKFKQMRMNILNSSGKDLAIYIAYNVTSKLLWLPYSMTSGAGASAQLARLRDIDQFRKLVTAESTLSYFDFPFIFIFLIAIMLLSGLAAVTVVAGVIVMLLYCIYARQNYERASSQNSRANAMVSYQWNELLAKLSSIQGLPLLQVIQSRFGAAHQQSLNDAHNVEMTNSGIQNTGQALTQVIGSASIVVAVLAVMEGVSDPSSMIVIIILVWKALSPIMGIFNALTRFKSIQNSAKQVNALMSLDDDRRFLEKSPPIDQFKGNVQVAGLTHRYPGNTRGLTNLEFKIRSGSKVTVVGPPGCGKSTLLRILGGLEPNYQGTVLCEGYNIRQFNSYRLRRAIKHVPFHSHFFYGTIRDNFELYNGAMRERDMRESLEMFALKDYFPDSITTMLTPSLLAELPNGIQQLLRLAVNLGDMRHGLFLLDEPLLGCAAEYSKVMTALNSGPLENKTVIACTNERSLVASFNECLLLDYEGGQKYFGAPDKVIQTL